MKKLLLVAAIAASVLSVDAAERVDGILYNFNVTAKTASVEAPAIMGGSDKTPYSGDIVVPATVVFNGETYTVRSISSYTFGMYSPGITSVTLPETILSLDNYSFYSSPLAEFVVPNSVTTIGNAFQTCPNLTKLTIGSGITNIGNNAFRNCDKLTEVTIRATVPPTASTTAFSSARIDLRGNITLYVPAGTAETYKAAAGWNGFKEYVEVAEPGPGVGIEGIEAADEAPARFFTLQGVEIDQPVKGQIVVEVRGSKATKRVIR